VRFRNAGCWPVGVALNREERRVPKKISRASSRDAALSGEGVMTALVDRVFENPANSGGLMVVALTATAIIANAMFLQNNRHAETVFSHAAAPPAAMSPPLPVAAPVQQQALAPAPVSTMPTPPLPRPSPARQQANANTAAAQSQATAQVMPPVASPAIVAPVPTPPVAVGMSAADQTALVTALQRELARLGLYTGKIDGRIGRTTSAAIASYEKAAGLAPTGKPSAALLAMMKTPLAAPPLSATPPSAMTAPANDPIAAVTAGEGAAIDQRTDARQATIAEQEKARADAATQARYRMVQTALNSIAYGPLTVNGQPDAPTADAIRRFELDSGMTLDGQASDAVVARLKAIGAVPPGN